MQNAALWIDPESISHHLKSIQQNAPIIHNITNFVVMNASANALLAIGASPIMAQSMDELDELLSMAGALIINIGTLDSAWIDAMARATAIASQKQLPIILDPVGAGASTLRTDTVLNLLNKGQITILRGNASEIMALNQARGVTKGVDSTQDSKDALQSAKSLSQSFNCVTVISGPVDYCVDTNHIIAIENGHWLMSRVTGMGCIASALTGAFSATHETPWIAASHAMAVMGISGELAAQTAHGPGSFFPNFLDALYQIDHGIIKRFCRIQRVSANE